MTIKFRKGCGLINNQLTNSYNGENIFPYLSNGVLIIDKNGKIILLNPSAKRFLNIKDEHYIGQDINTIIANTKFSLLLSSELNPIEMKMIIYGAQCVVNRTTLDHGVKLIEISNDNMFVSQNEHFHPLFEQMEKIIEFSTDGIFVVSKDGHVLFVNLAYESISGFKRELLIGKHMNDLINNGLLNQSVSLLVLKDKKRVSIIQTLGKQKDVVVTGNPVFDEAGNIQMIVSSVRDITELNKISLELKKAKSISNLSNNRYTFSSYDTDEKILFQSLKMKNVIDKVKQVASFPTSILLTGPSGSGKEVITNLIHQHSDRIDKPFIKINCGAIPEHLLESELFGYVKGAFTGASQDGKLGLLELADTGTVLLDEVGELPLLLQVKLLRVLQERKIQRLGDNKERKLDIRVVSATNQNLKQLVEQGDFREDLYYRLQVVEIDIPPLSERVEDIEILLEHFFSYYCHLYHIEKVLSPQTTEILNNYHWPGNVRELKNLVESMIVSVPSITIEPEDLPQHFITHSHSNASLKDRVEQFEKRIILDSIQKNTSIRNAAKSLGVHHTTLVKKLQKWKADIE